MGSEMGKSIIFKCAPLLIFFPLLVACYSQQTSWIKTDFEHHYDYDREVILKSIDAGKEDLFSPLSREEAFSDDRFLSAPIPWQQADYIAIALALSEEEGWIETFDQWEIGALHFDLS